MEFVELDAEHGETVKRAEAGGPRCARPESGTHGDTVRCWDPLASLSGAGDARGHSEVLGSPCFPVPPSKAAAGDTKRYPAGSRFLRAPPLL